MKKIIILFVSVFLYTCSSSSDPNENNPTIYISPANSEMSVSGENSLDIMIKDFEQSFFGISLQIEFDNTILTFSDSTDFIVGDLFIQNSVSFAGIDKSTIHLSFSMIKGQASVSGSGKICTLTFHAIAPGASAIDIVKDELCFYNSNGEEIKISELQLESAYIDIQ